MEGFKSLTFLLSTLETTEQKRGKLGVNLE